jgi:hypothetical protein
MAVHCRRKVTLFILRLSATWQSFPLNIHDNFQSARRCNDWLKILGDGRTSILTHVQNSHKEGLISKWKILFTVQKYKCITT